MDYKCKSPVLLIFFNRPDTFKKVFEKVRAAKPENLVLVQDGPRNKDDEKSVAECRKIAENIDWECNVIRDYSDVNLGCGMRPQTAISKALGIFDRVIILEDDCVPADSFFRYCDEMLEKYKDDDRIAYISGLNHFESWDCGSDYFFTKTGAIWGWATWSRVWNKYYDYYVNGIDNKYALKLVKKQFTNKYIAKTRIESWERARASVKNGEKLSYWDNQWGFVKYSQNMFVIVPAVNQIYNIGVGETSTHAQNLKTAEFKKYKNFICIPALEMKFPFSHPEYVVCDNDYDALVYKIMAGNPLRRIAARIIKSILKK